MADRAGDAGDEGANDSEWRFAVDEVGEDGVVDAERPPSPSVEPGSPNAENVVFFAVGVALAVGTFALLLL